MIDLKPLAPSPDAPKTGDRWHLRSADGTVWGRYNGAGWQWLLEHLVAWGVETQAFTGTYDGGIISETTCCAVADALEAHFDELNVQDQRWVAPHIVLWRTCGGYAQTDEGGLPSFTPPS